MSVPNKPYGFCGRKTPWKIIACLSIQDYCTCSTVSECSLRCHAIIMLYMLYVLYFCIVPFEQMGVFMQCNIVRKLFCWMKIIDNYRTCRILYKIWPKFRKKKLFLLFIKINHGCAFIGTNIVMQNTVNFAFYCWICSFVFLSVKRSTLISGQHHWGGIDVN